MYSTRYSCPIVKKTWIFWTDFRQILEYQILWKSVQWEPSCPILRTDGQSWRRQKSLFALLRTHLRLQQMLTQCTCVQFGRQLPEFLRSWPFARFGCTNMAVLRNVTPFFPDCPVPSSMPWERLLSKQPTGHSRVNEWRHRWEGTAVQSSSSDYGRKRKQEIPKDLRSVCS
jgi:hypothetical protein